MSAFHPLPKSSASTSGAYISNDRVTRGGSAVSFVRPLHSMILQRGLRPAHEICSWSTRQRGMGRSAFMAFQGLRRQSRLKRHDGPGQRATAFSAKLETDLADRHVQSLAISRQWPRCHLNGRSSALHSECEAQATRVRSCVVYHAGNWLNKSKRLHEIWVIF